LGTTAVGGLFLSIFARAKNFIVKASNVVASFLLQIFSLSLLSLRSYSLKSCNGENYFTIFVIGFEGDEIISPNFAFLYFYDLAILLLFIELQ
jgi:hypothetical protein